MYRAQGDILRACRHIVRMSDMCHLIPILRPQNERSTKHTKWFAHWLDLVDPPGGFVQTTSSDIEANGYWPFVSAGRVRVCALSERSAGRPLQDQLRKPFDRRDLLHGEQSNASG